MFSRLTTLTPLEKQDNAMKSADPNAMKSADPNTLLPIQDNASIQEDENTIESVTNKSDESINVIENPALHVSDDVFTLSSDSSPNRSWNSTPDLESVYIYHTDDNYTYREFFYLHENRLDKEYTCYGTKTIHICTFAMNHSCSYQEDPLPFLQFLLSPSENKWVFPHFQFQCSQHLEYENVQMYFLNECTKHMLDSFVIEGHLQEMENMSKLYRGCIECGEQDVVVVFDMTQFVELTLRQQTMWFIASEVTNQNLVSSFVRDFFGKYAYMTRIETQHNIVMELPRLLYLYDVEKREHVKHPLTMLEPRSFHPSYGHFYYFVKEHPPGSPQQYVRCAVFMENVTVIDGQPLEVFMTNQTDSIGSLNEDLGKVDSTSSPEDLGDLESDTSTVDVGENTSENDVLESSSDDSLDEFLDEVEQPIVPESTKTMDAKPVESPSQILDESSLLPFSSIVIFTEGDTKLWCVKTESLFTAMNI